MANTHFTVGGSEYITIVADYLGAGRPVLCVRSYAGGATYTRSLAASPNLFCPGTTVDVFVSEGDAENYGGFQWFQLGDGSDYSAIDGATDSRYTIADAGTYRVEAIPAGCRVLLLRWIPLPLKTTPSVRFY